MYAQSHFRWVSEDAARIALGYTRGRVVFEAPAHLRRLDQQLMELKEWKCQISDAMAGPLRAARGCYRGPAWVEALALIGLSEYDARVLIGSAQPIPPGGNPDVRRALRGWPLPNPLTQVWELRQVQSMYQAGENLLEDAVADLVLELAARHGWDNLAALTVDRCGGQLQRRVGRQREERGEPGDPRRVAAQRYESPFPPGVS